MLVTSLLLLHDVHSVHLRDTYDFIVTLSHLALAKSDIISACHSVTLHPSCVVVVVHVALHVRCCRCRASGLLMLV